MGRSAEKPPKVRRFLLIRACWLVGLGIPLSVALTLAAVVTAYVFGYGVAYLLAYCNDFRMDETPLMLVFGSATLGCFAVEALGLYKLHVAVYRRIAKWPGCRPADPSNAIETRVESP